ncbi:MAG: Mur ligase domain-containing protein [Bacteroidales bacterium]|nr:Mur ligase domain-containing protein [Bacteroidales bacterium]
MKIHFIAIGGSAMHSLAIALHNQGHTISGSDDEIFEPARSNLEKYGLLPEKEGFFTEKIKPDLDAIVLGMHAKADNVELIAAKQKGIKIYSYPEFLFEASKNKKRIVIGGSHGKTTITSMILHVFRTYGVETDYMVGAKLDAFEQSVRLSDTANYIVLEGDEYLTSTLDPRPKFHLYNPTIALLSGIAWDHINVFPSFETYVEQFRLFIDTITPGGTLVYCNEDKNLRDLVKNARQDIKYLPYETVPYRVENNVTMSYYRGNDYALKIFGHHNLSNLSGAMLVCEQAGIIKQRFWEAIVSFKGASKRLEKIGGTERVSVFKDFAHSPSKLKATITAVKEQYPKRKLIVCIELHTYSSLTSEFLKEYKGTMDLADEAIVFYSPHAIALKRLPPVNEADIRTAFNRNNIRVFNDKTALETALLNFDYTDSNLLMCSSGNFDALDLNRLCETVIRKTE